MTARAIDPTFLALPLDRLADTALEVAKHGGATYADFRVERPEIDVGQAQLVLANQHDQPPSTAMI